MRCETHVGSITVNIKAPMCHILKCLTVSNVITSKQKTKVKPSEQFECCYDHIKCTYKDLKLTHKKTAPDETILFKLYRLTTIYIITM